MLKRIGAFALCLVILTSVVSAGYSDLQSPEISAAAAVLVDAKTGEVLFERNMDAKRAPASITKIMTVLLALEMGNMESTVTVNESALVDLDPEGSTQNLVPGEEIKLIDLLYCAMTASANESCNVIAEHISGSVEAFVELMNTKAAEYGMENTNFTNTHGLPGINHYTTAYDIYLLCAKALQNQTFREMAHTETYTIPPTNKKPEGRALHTTNRLISRHTSAEYIYPYAKGIKTGHTGEAGYCLASCAEKEELSLISVVLGSVREEDGTIRSFTDTKELFEWGFNSFETKKLLLRTEVIDSVPIIHGLDNERMELVPENEISALVPKNIKPEDIEKKVTIFDPEGVVAPIEKGQILGSLSISIEDRDFGSVNLVALTSEDSDETAKIYEKTTSFFKQGWVIAVILSVIGIIIAYIVLVFIYNRRRKKKMRTGYQSYKGKKRK